MLQTDDGRHLIPPPGVIRVELARAVREARRLRSLLRLAAQAQQDRHDLAEIARQQADAAPHQADGRGGRP